MTAKFIRSITVLAAIVLSAILSANANAQCCGGATTAFHQPAAYSAYYQPAAYTAFSPVAVQTYRTGWYPGYFLDRIRTRLWGSPTTYVAAYPSTYVASYPSTYAASYPSTYAASYAPSYSVGYASSFSPCCSPCSSCSTCGVSEVSQASFPSGGCSSCGVAPANGSTVIVPNGTVVPPTSTQQGAPSSEPQPELAPSEQVPSERTYQRPPNGGAQQPVQSEPDDDADEADLESVLEGEASDGSSYFEPPKLFDLNDRTAQRSIAPVRHAVYQQQVTHTNVSAPRSATAERARQDAKGWTSASN
jgi:hypothetical protein